MSSENKEYQRLSNTIQNNENKNDLLNHNHNRHCSEVITTKQSVKGLSLQNFNGMGINLFQKLQAQRISEIQEKQRAKKLKNDFYFKLKKKVSHKLGRLQRNYMIHAKLKRQQTQSLKKIIEGCQREKHLRKQPKRTSTGRVKESNVGGSGYQLNKNKIRNRQPQTQLFDEDNIYQPLQQPTKKQIRRAVTATNSEKKLLKDKFWEKQYNIVINHQNSKFKKQSRTNKYKNLSNLLTKKVSTEITQVSNSDKKDIQFQIKQKQELKRQHKTLKQISNQYVLIQTQKYSLKINNLIKNCKKQDQNLTQIKKNIRTFAYYSDIINQRLDNSKNKFILQQNILENSFQNLF